MSYVLQATRAALTSEEGIQAARLSRKLVTIQTDVQLPPLKLPFSHLLLQPPSDTTRAAVKAAFAALEFKQHEKRLDAVWDKMASNQTPPVTGQGVERGSLNQPTAELETESQPSSPLEQPVADLK